MHWFSWLSKLKQNLKLATESQKQEVSLISKFIYHSFHLVSHTFLRAAQSDTAPLS